MSCNKGWVDLLANYKKKTIFKEVLAFVEHERQQGKEIFPKKHDVFNAFKFCPFEQLKVVILGQDPYHNLNQANGLAFSVQDSVKLPPSLMNIYKELKSDLKIQKVRSGDLKPWAYQGVFLLNTVLTVEAHKAHSHANKGWECFTDHVISQINKYKEDVVFLLWGSLAQKKAALIDTGKHCILRAPHPSPLSAYRGFFGCNHFSKTNDYLEEKKLKAINWLLPNKWIYY